jgi:superfamily II DNA/RNA helicase
MPTLINKNMIVHAADADASDKQRSQQITAIEYIKEKLEARKKMPTTLDTRILILKSGTGSGKTTTIPPEMFLSQTARIANVICAVPRVILALEQPYIIEQIYKGKLSLGKNMGYSTGSNKMQFRGAKGLMYVTTGTLLHLLKYNEPELVMAKYSYIIVDEVHEQDNDTEGTLITIKSIVTKHYNDLKCPTFIFMSATLDTNRLARFFGVNPKLCVIEVAGEASYPIKEIYLNEPKPIIAYIVQKVKEIHSGLIEQKSAGTAPKLRDIIIFVDGKKFGTTVRDLIMKDMDNEIKSDTLAVGYIDKSGAVSQNDDYRRVLGVSATAYQRIAISTNFAEVGFTIPTLGYCIDTALERHVQFNPLTGYDFGTVRAISHFKAIQRRGRVGRVGAGEWHPLFSEQIYRKDMEYANTPNSVKNDLTQALYEYFANSVDGKINLGEISLDPIPYDQLQFSMEKLCKLGLFTKNTVNPNAVSSSAVIAPPRALVLTALGKFVYNLGYLGIEDGIAIAMSYVYRASTADLITALITYLMYIESDSYKEKYIKRPEFAERMKKMLGTEAYQELCANTFIGDAYLLAYLIFLDFVYTKDTAEFCAFYEVREDLFIDIATKRDQCIASISAKKLDPYQNRYHAQHGSFNLLALIKESPKKGVAEFVRILKCVHIGHQLKYAEYVPYLGVYKTLLRGMYLQPPLKNKYFKAYCQTMCGGKLPRILCVYDITDSPDTQKITTFGIPSYTSIARTIWPGLSIHS